MPGYGMTYCGWRRTVRGGCCPRAACWRSVPLARPCATCWSAPGGPACGLWLDGRRTSAIVSESRHARSPRRWLVWVALGTALVVGGVVGGLIVGATQSSGSTVSQGNSVSSSTASTASACPVTSVAEQVVPSVVTIGASGPNGSGTGSGEVIRSGGYVLTNNHVISVAAAGGGSVQVLFADGQTESATITGRDPLTDLAVLHVETS